MPLRVHRACCFWLLPYCELQQTAPCALSNRPAPPPPPRSLSLQVPGGWVLSGQKRWIGNGTWSDVTIMWAKSSESGEVRGVGLGQGIRVFRMAGGR